MSVLERPVTKRRPVYLNLVRIRLPLPGLVSILHRMSGAALFFVGLPLLLVGCRAQPRLAARRFDAFALAPCRRRSQRSC